MTYSSTVLADSPLFWARLGDASAPIIATATASGSNGTETPSKAFDGGSSTQWTSNATSTGWLQAQLSGAFAVQSYAILGRRDATPNRSPAAWTFQGSDDGSTWTTLDTRSGQTWASGEVKSFTFTNTTAYLYYRLNVTANSGDTYLNVPDMWIGTLPDSSGNVRPAMWRAGATMGATGLLTGDSNTAGDFASSYADVGYQSWMDQAAFSVEALAKPDTPTATNVILGRQVSGAEAFSLQVTSSVVKFVWTDSGGTTRTLLSSSTLSSGTAYHIVATHDGTSTAKIYLNGTLDNSVTVGTAPRSATSSLRLGAHNAGAPQYYFDGVLDEVSFYGSALSSTRVSAHYTAATTAPATSGTFAATLPTPVTAAFTGTYRDVGTFSATLPQVAASLSGTYAAPPSGDLAATLPSPLTTDFAGTYTAPANPTGSFAATLPTVAASFAGDYHPHEAGTFDAVLPFPTADFTGTYTPGLESGSFDATLPVVTADFAGTYTSPSGTTGTFAASLPLVVAAFTGTYDGPIPTDTSNAFAGRIRHGSATVTITRPVAAVPPSVSLGQRYDKALAFPEPVMVDGRPT